jgi:hypothetical protein
MITIASIDGLLDSLEHIAGFLFVVFVLTTLWLMIALMGMVFKRKGKQPASDKITLVPASGLSILQDGSGEIPDEDLVLIATTVAMLLGRKPHRLVSIRSTNFDWGREGRRQHVMSHTTH